MRITDLLTEKTIALNVKASSKEDVIKQAVQLIAKSGAIEDVAVYEKGVQELKELFRLQQARRRGASRHAASRGKGSRRGERRFVQKRGFASIQGE